MRIRRYAARLLASTTTSSSPPCLLPAAAAAASSRSCGAADDCAICELNRFNPQVNPDSGKQKGHFASRVEAELKGNETVNLVHQPSVSEAEESKIADEPLVNEAVAKPEVAEAVFASGDAAVSDEPRPGDCDSEVDNLLAGNAAEVGASTTQSFEDDTVDGLVNSATSSPVGAKISSIQEVAPNSGFIDASNDSCVSDIVARSIGNSGRTDIICYVRRTGKRKKEIELKTLNSQTDDGFINNHCEEKEIVERTDPSNTFDDFVRGPCESLNSTARSALVENVAMETKIVDNSAANQGKKMKTEPYECDIDFCRMTFKTRAELSVHKRNMCTVESCSKRFRSHKYLRRHQRVHSNERPFKCPWEGCSMTFKWLWAQTEHVRVHTGERPYICMAPGCGQTFKYVSDFSRHRRKFKHQRYSFA